MDPNRPLSAEHFRNNKDDNSSEKAAATKEIDR
jgi:hypothetical protein